MNETESKRRQNYYHMKEKKRVIWIYEAGNENS